MSGACTLTLLANLLEILLLVLQQPRVGKLYKDRHIHDNAQNIAHCVEVEERERVVDGALQCKAPCYCDSKHKKVVS